MSAWHTLLIIVGILVALLGLSAIVIQLQKNYPGEQYDERQKQARGEGYRLAFWAGTIYYLLIGLGIGLENPDSDMVFSLLMAGILGQMMLLHFYCFLTHAVLPFGQKPLGNAACYSVLGSIYIIEYAFLSRGWIQLTVGICILTLALLHLITHIRRNKE